MTAVVQGNKASLMSRLAASNDAKKATQNGQANVADSEEQAELVSIVQKALSGHMARQMCS